MVPRWTAWIEQASGSMKAACSTGIVRGTLWFSAPAGNSMYSAIAPNVAWRKP